MLSFIKRFEEIVSSVAMAVMVLLISIQVFNRYVLSSSLDWTEELARYLFIWSIYVGCSYAMKEDRHLEVTILREFGTKTSKKVVTILAYVLTLLFCVAVTIYGIDMLKFLMGTGQKAPALQVPMYWFFASIPVGMGLMALRTVERIWKIIKQKDDEDSIRGV